MLAREAPAPGRTLPRKEIKRHRCAHAQGKTPITLATVPFCHFLPGGLQGVANATNKANLKDNSLRCSAVERRQWAIPGPTNTDSATEQHARGRSGQDEGAAEEDTQHSARETASPSAGGVELGWGDVASSSTGSGRRLLQLAARGGACIWHDGCDPEVVDPLTGSKGQFCAKGGYCEVCSFCQVGASAWRM